MRMRIVVGSRAHTLSSLLQRIKSHPHVAFKQYVIPFKHS